MYKLKHKPSGLYYQPGPNNLSVKGKIYQSGNNLLTGYKENDKFFIHVSKDRTIHRNYPNLKWEEDRWRSYRIRILTSVSDWEIEELKIETC